MNNYSLIKVKVQVEAKEDIVIKKSDDSYIVKVKEKRERGEANRKVNILLTNYFNVAPGNIRLIKGGKRGNKIFEVSYN